MGTDTDTIERRRSGRPSLSDARRLHNRIVDCALDSFLRQGFELTTIERVAATCRTTRRSVMHRFPTKEALFLAAALRFRELSTYPLPTVEDAGEPLEELKSACRTLLHHALNPRTIAFFRVVSGVAERVTGLSELILDWDNENALQVEKIVLRAQCTGVFERYSAVSIATAVIGVMLSNPVNRALFGDPQFKGEHQADLYFSQMWAIFLGMA